MVDVLNTGKWTPQQALLRATQIEDEIDHCAIVYIRKDEQIPRLIYSDLRAVDLNFLGLAVQLHSIKHMKE